MALVAHNPVRRIMRRKRRPYGLDLAEFVHSPYATPLNKHLVSRYKIGMSNAGYRAPGSNARYRLMYVSMNPEQFVHFHRTGVLVLSRHALKGQRHHAVYLTHAQQKKLNRYFLRPHAPWVKIHMSPMQAQWNRRYGHGFLDKFKAGLSKLHNAVKPHLGLIGGLAQHHLGNLLPGLIQRGVGAIQNRFGDTIGGLAQLAGEHGQQLLMNTLANHLGGTGIRRRRPRHMMRAHHYRHRLLTGGTPMERLRNWNRLNPV